MNTAIKIHIHFLITNHNNLSHLPASSTMRRGKCVWAPSFLDRDAFFSGRKLLSRASHQSPGDGGEAIIWNTSKEVLKWSPHSREVVYFLNVCLHKFSQNMSPWIYHFSPGWKDRQIQVVLIFLSEKDHSLGIVEAISMTWWWVSNQRMSGVTPELGEQWCTRNLFLCTKGVSKCQWPPSVGAMGVQIMPSWPPGVPSHLVS